MSVRVSPTEKIRAEIDALFGGEGSGPRVVALHGLAGVDGLTI